MTTTGVQSLVPRFNVDNNEYNSECVIFMTDVFNTGVASIYLCRRICEIFSCELCPGIFIASHLQFIMVDTI